ncbi:MAG: YggS family pyridoxal phosphate-dependent enzyme [Dethiosulfovibrio sp.]|nr:YggS family pyridoxal phosphate-dependent enzyme [Dethiosulfovibrio sp.]
MVDSKLVEDRVFSIVAEIKDISLRSGRDPKDVKLLAVSKTHPIETLLPAVDTGLLWGLGENKVQEGESKVQDWPEGHPVSWHLIGHLQRNKARKALSLFSMIHSLDSLKLGETMDRLVKEMGLSPYPVLVEVNTSGEAAKHGVMPDDALPMVLSLTELCPNLEVLGLMTVGPLSDDRSDTARAFESLRLLRDRISIETGLPLREPSMGMSGDFDLAIEQGSTVVRIGSSIFGVRERR